MERRQALQAARIDIGALFEQQRDPCRIGGQHGVAKLLLEIGAFGKPCLDALCVDALARRLCV
jgi:hypothetical protein